MEKKLGSKFSNPGSRSPYPLSSSPSDFSRSSIASSGCRSDGYRSDVSRTFMGGKVRTVAGSCIACFRPCRGAAWTLGDNEEDDHVRDLSSTASRGASSSGRGASSSGRGARLVGRGGAVSSEDPAKWSMADVSRATGNFSAANIAGQGGFATVYKGRLGDGSLIAVKRAKKELFDSHVGAEFKNEIRTLSQIEHLNLVRFLGFVEHADERIVLVEYVANGNLRDHLDGSRGNGLEMGQRIDIAIDIAHALTYLHTYTDRPIIHRDVKASNVLITEELRAKVADFGFAKIADEGSDATHISTQVKGTAGYLDPEYLRTYQLTDKSDVYSFGVILVEIVSGRRPIELKRGARDRLTVKWAIQRYREGNAVMVMDPRLRRSPASVTGAEQILGLAAQCLVPSRRSRPSMKRCSEALWGIRKKFWDMEIGASSGAASSMGPSTS